MSEPDGPADGENTSPDNTGAAPRGPTDEVFDAEIVSPPTTPLPFPAADADLTTGSYTDAGIPTFDFVRDKIENRITTAIGSKELADESAEGQHVDEIIRKRDEAAKNRLEEIRKSMGR